MTTIDGYTVKAKDAVVLATGSPINHNLALHPRQHPSRSYVLGFEVPKVQNKRHAPNIYIYIYIYI